MSEKSTEAITHLDTREVRNQQLAESMRMLRLEQQDLLVKPKDPIVDYVYASKNPGLFYRFHKPKIVKEQPLGMSVVKTTEEWIAAIAPFVAIVPLEAQKAISQAIHESGYARPDEIVESDGIVMQEHYSGGPSDLIGNKSLKYPHISVHIYTKDRKFSREIVFKFMSKEDQEQLDLYGEPHSLDNKPTGLRHNPFSKIDVGWCLVA